MAGSSSRPDGPPRRLAATALPPEAIRGRGATANPDGRFEAARHERFDDGWEADAHSAPRTEVRPEHPRRILTRNASPDIPFDRSINPYRGCEHGCIYCFARPTHSYLGLSPGLDFETRLFTKPDAARLLARELSRPGYRPATIALGTATDPYQPIEREHRITREVLGVLARFRHPVGIVTKSDLVTRDIDILAGMAARRLVKVGVSLATLDPRLARRMDPRAPAPRKRLAAMRALSDAGVPVMAITAPIIPALNDHEIEALLEAARAHGAGEASHVLLRLPHELKDLVADWLAAHYPERRARVLAMVADTRGGRANDPCFGSRMTGEGPYARMIGERFRLARARLGFRRERLVLSTEAFRVPRDQLDLF